MQIAIASDHGGFGLKEEIKKYLGEEGLSYRDFGCGSEQSCDYPDFGLPAAESVRDGKCDKGILICKSGIGMSMAANKVKGIRAALCHTPEIARKSRQHNDSNILVMAAQVVDWEAAKEIIDIWLDTDFEEGRHQGRLDKINNYEKGTGFGNR